MNTLRRIALTATCMSLWASLTMADMAQTLLEDEVGRLGSEVQAQSSVLEQSPLSFTEVYTHSISPYWCEHNLVTGDYDEDGDIDMIAHVTTGGVGSREARVLLFTNDGSHHFAVTEIDSVREYGYKIVTADFNNDGHLDFAVRASSTRVYLGDGTGSFSLHQEFTDGWGYGGFDCADLDLDGDVDLVQGYQACCGGRMAALYNDGTGTFTVGWEKTFTGYGAAATIRNLVITHADPDAWPDIVATEIYGGMGYVLQSQSGGTSFSQVWSMAFGGRTGTRVYGVTDIDLDSDPVQEIAFSYGSGSVTMFNSDEGVLSPVWSSPTYGEVSYSLGSGDFDGDGREDLFVGNFGGGRMYIYRNIDGDSLTQIWTDRVPGSGYLGSVVDINQDGLPDLVVGEREMIRVWINKTERVRPVALDIKPGSCPNPVNAKDKPTRGKSVVPAAILGSAEVDVRDIDPSTIELEGLTPVRWSYEDVSAPVDDSGDGCVCSDSGPDGFDDLTLKFDRNELAAKLLAMRDAVSAGDEIDERSGSGRSVAVSGAGADREEFRVEIVGSFGDGTLLSGYDCVLLIDHSESEAGLVAMQAPDAENELVGNFPNPFNPATEIEYRLAHASQVRLEVYNIAGRRVATLATGYRAAGHHTAIWDGSKVASGVYLYRLQTDHGSEVRKMILLK